MNAEQYYSKKRFFQVYSAHRDLTRYPDPARFTIKLPSKYINVESIEISSGNIPIAPITENDAFVYLDIPQLNHIATSDGNSYFGILALHQTNSTIFYSTDKSSTNIMPKVFTEPATISEISITLRQPDGSIILLGNETVCEPNLQCSFIFQIKTRERNNKLFAQDSRISKVSLE